MWDVVERMDPAVRDQVKRQLRASAMQARPDFDEARAALEGMSPQGRLYRPDEVTSAALWLCSDGAAGVNGQGIVISGGEV